MDCHTSLCEARNDGRVFCHCEDCKDEAIYTFFRHSEICLQSEESILDSYRFFATLRMTGVFGFFGFAKVMTGGNKLPRFPRKARND